jgi:hypothetical protein
VGEARDAVADFEVLGDFGADLHDGARVVAADSAAFAWFGERAEVDVLPYKVSVWEPRCKANGTEYSLPVGRVESNGVDLDEDIVVPHLRQRNLLHLSLANADVFDGLHGFG